ncbi:reverse transcriptase [Plakobranchus ocellatus]|uniref:Reverse transcriptase n=1 Tax=Plakobranchus ocellatus TaxID=259542 RepID=A0AAV3YGE6_9GAST|nr:reverse transcriptase [Plakobranchus ocellatus]
MYRKGSSTVSECLGKPFKRLNLVDFASADSSEPHQIIDPAISKNLPYSRGYSSNVRRLFSGFKIRFSTERYATDWINLEIGIAMGCTISLILFVLAMEMGGASSADLSGECYMPSLKVFMDDTTILCSTEKETRRMLVRLDALMN